MFLDVTTEYTGEESRYKEDFANQVNLYKDNNIADYTNSYIIIFDLNFSYTSIIKQDIVPAPENLKRAMFRTSSRGMLISLLKFQSYINRFNGYLVKLVRSVDRIR